jgi:hypothetical protein
MCCAGNMCQADPVAQIRECQKKINAGTDRFEEAEANRKMLEVASSNAAKMKVKPQLTALFPRNANNSINNISEQDRKKATLHILLLEAFPWDSLIVTRAVEELLDLPSVSKQNLKNMLQTLRPANNSPINKWIQRI